MNAVSESQVLALAEELGFVVVRFKDGDLRIDPPSPFLLVTLQQDRKNVRDAIDVKAFKGVRFYLVGRSACCPLRNDASRDISIPPPHPIEESRSYAVATATELLSLVDEWRPFRVSGKNDFYAFPQTGSFLVYASHHDEVYFYCGWQGAKVPPPQ